MNNASASKVIFLDIDGVLNSFAYNLYRKDGETSIDHTRLPLLKRIVDETGAVIVLSSSWRLHWERDGQSWHVGGHYMDGEFATVGLTLYDKTPVLGNRADEISAWLRANPSTKSFVIIDDMVCNWGRLAHNLVQTDYRIGRGLEEEHVKRAIEILNAI